MSWVVVVVGSVFAGIGVPAMAQGPTWANGHVEPVPREQNSMAYDRGRGRIVLFGGLGNGAALLGDIWEHDGNAWIRMLPAHSPTARFDAAMAFDPVRGVTVMFGGTSSVTHQDTWEWDGSDWQQVFPATSPPPLSAHCAAWHGGVNPGVLVHGGFHGAVMNTQTWLFDGVNWSLRDANGPTCQHTGMAYVPTTQLTYVISGGGLLPWQLWAWSGTAWSPVVSTIGASFSRGGRLTWDEDHGYLVTIIQGAAMLRGYLTSPLTIPIWTYSPSQASIYGQVVYNRARHSLCCFGGATYAGWPHLPSLREATNTTWVIRTPATTAPTPRAYADMAFAASNGNMVLFGGQDSFGVNNDTWTLDGALWTGHGPSAFVYARTKPALCHGANIGTVLFGGGGGPLSSTYYGDTWLWSGADWTPAGLAGGSPPARAGHDMVFDSQHGVMVMYGGYNGSTLGDTWLLFPGGVMQWIQVFPANTPGPRQGHAMAFDQRRGRVVMFGGADASVGFLDDTWELYQGATFPFAWQWVQRTPAQSPPRRRQHKMDYDATRGVVVMTGGYGNPQCGPSCASHLNDVWEYDGGNWRQRVPNTTLPEVREGANFAYDSQRQRFVLQGGDGNGLNPTDTWFYTAPNDTYGAGMQGGSSLKLRCTQFPIAGETTGFAIDTPLGFGWITIYPAPAPQPGITLGPGLLCSTGSFYGVGAVIADAMGFPGTTTFQLPTAMLGQGFVAQGISLESGICLALTDPLAVTIHAP